MTGRARTIVAVLLTVGLAAGCGSSVRTAGVATGTPRSIAEPRLSWSVCGVLPTPEPTTSAAPSTRFECATLQVPLDYAHPADGTIGIAVIRTRATDQRRRIGSLIFNFGGPGASGVEMLAQTADYFQKLGTRYDLVSFDPRGVGESAPIACLNDARTDAARTADASPDDPAEVATFERFKRETMRACERRSGRVLPYVGTVNAARDMDVLRGALGDSRLNYFGFSYGTQLGASYAHQFPTRVGRMVLDGAVDPRQGTEDVLLAQTTGFQRALDAFASTCASQGGQICPLGKEQRSVEAAIAALLKGLDAKPIPTQLGRRLTQSLALQGITASLYSEKAWPSLALGLIQAQHGDGTILIAFADQLAERDPKGHYSNFGPAMTAIACDDTTERYTTAQVLAALPAFTRASPIFGPSFAWGLLDCTGWPARGDNAAKDVSAPGTAPIVVIGNTGDPATPYAWARALAAQLGNAVLVTLKAQGHTAYLTGNFCVQNAVDEYLLNGTVPADRTTCS